ncbi:MAG: glutamate formimidoyltransferase [Spirochaetes bacterium]|nr:glutamate formimidoyltransferase [Spirochaetota bacterium]
MKIVECVPNFSEGRDECTIELIAHAVLSVPHVTMLDVDPGIDTNRTVFTFVGPPEAVLEASFRAIQVGSALIDMSKHKGAHPRMGACDVCPFVPVFGSSMEECSQIARMLGKRVGDELGIPVYLYGHAASGRERRDLANVRSGEYEGLEKKMSDPKWRPDFGPVSFDERVKKSGASVIGSREFLIAYNINLDSQDAELAASIAKLIREKGGTVVGKDGGKTKTAGMFKECKAIGWYVDDYKRAQVSVNLTNYHTTGLHHVFDAVRREARTRGSDATGSEIVGLVPKEAIVESGVHYLAKRGESSPPEKRAIDAAVESLGLDELRPFIPSEKIVEFRIGRKPLLRSMAFDAFAGELSSDSPAPGGGSVSAACGAVASALVSMIGSLTAGKKKYREAEEEATRIVSSARGHMERFLRLIDDDADAFNGVIDAVRAKKGVQEATRQAIETPYRMMKLADSLCEDLRRVCGIGNPNTVSEMAIAVHLLRTAVNGALFNVILNIGGVTDKSYTASVLSDAGRILKRTEETLKTLQSDLERRFEEMAKSPLFRRHGDGIS